MKRVPIPVTISKGGEIHHFDSLYSCGKFLKCQAGQITTRPTYKGWNILLHGKRTKRKDLKCKVYLFQKTGEFIKEFESVHECSRCLCISETNLVVYIKNGKYKDYLLSYTKQNENTFDINDYI
tara:strand:+ start:9329 stop:9700 length:372 start_codon:yes stop_codon:yes gene_type:complete